MKSLILRATAFGLAAALSGAVACGSGSSSGCGGPSANTDGSTPQQTQLSCGSGTHLVGNTCVSDTANSSATTRYLGH